ncbi:radical SAM protein [Ectothiorhodospira mobilis]|uniref:radical SAM protein n=1 Tax=Ectothiorhodospira mobilis TaxID=195064 RepID=UPI00190871ED|nr:radical SAM protein [Ectothiorhodospira mobilis]MBK1691026.1 radical SAM protein [Ectothiorhodospira mobilis]
MYKHLFGPVPSRRLGMSLGVDLVPPKVCSYNCVYCECGKTTTPTARRDEYVPVDEVLAELGRFLEENPAPDYITLSGSGEPTLNSRIGEVIRFIKSQSRDIPVAVLTNGSLLSDPKVRGELLPADLVLPSLDAATEATFRRMDRPVRAVRLDDCIQGLVDFRREFSGRIWVEVMLLAGYNDNPEDLRRLREALVRIAPDRIQLNTLDRPGVLADLQAVSPETLERIRQDWGLDQVEIIAAVARRQGPAYRRDTESAILDTIARRPCTVEDLEGILGLHANEVNKYLGALEADGRVEPVRLARGLFYRLRHAQAAQEPSGHGG